MIPMYYVFHNAKVEENKKEDYSTILPCSLITEAYKILDKE